MNRQEYGEENGNDTQKTRRRMLFAVGAVLLAVAAGSCAVLIRLGVRQEQYNSAIQMADRYVTAGDYKSAILEYQKAISLDKKKERAYRGLVSVYESANDYANALAAAEQGLSFLDSDYLNEKKITLLTLIDKGEITAFAKPLSSEEIQEASKDAAMENTTFDLIAAYTYTEYFRDFGYPSEKKREGKETVLFYEDMDLSAVYSDLPNEKVLDADFMPVATAKPVKVRLNNIRRLFSVGAQQFAVSRDRLKELLADAAFSKDEASGRYFVTAEYKGCSLSVETDANGNIVSEAAWNELKPLNRSRFEEKPEADGEAGGYVQDAVTGKGIRASLKIRARGKKTGDTAAELESGADGSYKFAGAQGSYTAEVSSDGYVTEYLDLEITKGQTHMGRNIVLSPKVAEGEIRIVLTWGSAPSDLDAYAAGTSSTGRNFNINFRNKNEADIGNLDVDEQSGFGPETITITDTGAEFTYSVEDYRREGTMPSSQAVVKVYLPGGAPAKEYRVPSGEGIVWEVFHYKDGELTQINRLYQTE